MSSATKATRGKPGTPSANVRSRNRKSCTGGRGTKSDSGQACEYLVCADLLSRGLHVTKPLNTNGPDDVHAKCGRRWYTFQVKASRVNVSTGSILNDFAKCRVLSDVLALVDLSTKRIRYVPAMIKFIPKELRDASI